ncbi:translation initiation factor IF-2 [Patescibacteria group bacterium]|nr:translation initiation factor IF-2 [Patescibacteria group bacterium]
MYLSDIARKLRMRDKDLKQKIKALGYSLKPRVRTLDDVIGKEIIAKIEAERKALEVENEEIPERPAEIAISESITVGDLSAKMNVSVPDVIKELMKNGILATINEEIDFETATLIADIFEIKTKLHIDQEKLDKEKGIRLRLKKEIDAQNDKETKVRPPIVTIMGHVDHGKTTLLDAVRETNVTAEESGGITQHIGAYQAKIKGKLITFLDTPGHEAFSAMRARGARVTDVAILIVAADDGVKPQTKEALDLIKKAEVPFIVAINKIDKPEANVEKVKKELADLDVNPEDWGGDVVMVEISAKNKLNIDSLLEMILLVSEMENLKADDKALAIGTIVEQRKDAQKGAVATVLIQNGTLKIGDFVTVGDVIGSIRSMENFQGKKIDHAKPSTPVQILGLESLPEVGDILQAVGDKEQAKIKISRLKKLRRKVKKNDDKRKEGIKKLNLIIKSDVQGSLEAILDEVAKIKSSKVVAEVVDFGVGKVTESDIMLANSASAKILMFRTTTSAVATHLAREKKVDTEEFSVIYELIDKIRQYLNDLIEPEVSKENIGRLEILAVFRTEKGRMIVGGKINKGKIKDKTEAIVKREEEEIGKGKIVNLQSGKVSVDEVTQGKECGVVFEGDVKIKEGDILEIIEEKVTKAEVI